MKTRIFPGEVFALLLLLIPAIFTSCASSAAKAEEYFSIGMAYYEMGKYTEAEKWLNRAQSMDKTMTASDYNLGRIAFETGRYEDAAKSFERILKRDPDNVMALKAAAYSRIKNGDLEKAEALYNRVLALVPESADDGFNYALVLYGIKKYDKCEEELNKYPFALEENANSILLLARTQNAQGKIEAVDSYAKWLNVNTQPNAQGLYEYAQVLENAGFFARSLEQYKAAIKALDADTADLTKSKIRFYEARLLLTADPKNNEGMTELNTAVTEGFNDTEAIQALMKDDRISQVNKDEIRKILESILSKAKPAEAVPENAAPEASQTEPSEPKTSESE